jgi:hypothetical protein
MITASRVSKLVLGLDSNPCIAIAAKYSRLVKPPAKKSSATGNA